MDRLREMGRLRERENDWESEIVERKEKDRAAVALVLERSGMKFKPSFLKNEYEGTGPQQRSRALRTTLKRSRVASKP